MIDKSVRASRRGLGTSGNVMIMGVVVITLLSMFGVVLVSRMVVDANAAAKRINASQAFYLADAGIQWGRRYLKNGNTADQTRTDVPFGAGTWSADFSRTTAYWQGTGGGDNLNVYQIIATGKVGNTTRQIIELRKRGAGSGFNDKQFMMWHEDVQNEY